MTPRWATTAVFVVNGAAIGTWVAQIPWMQERFDLSKSAMGLLIIGMAIAVILAFPIAGQAIVRHGSERIRWSAASPRARGDAARLRARAGVRAAGLFVLGGSCATQDVSMNSHGVKVEKDLGRPIMSSLHAGWAFGGMVGAAFAAPPTAFGIDAHAVPIASAILLVTLVVSARAHRRRLGGGGRRHAGLHAALARRRAAGDHLPARHGHRGRDGRLGRAVPAPGPGRERRAGRARLLVLHRRHDRRARRRRLDQPRIGAVALLRWGALLTGLPLGAMLLSASRPPR